MHAEWERAINRSSRPRNPARAHSNYHLSCPLVVVSLPENHADDEHFIKRCSHQKGATMKNEKKPLLYFYQDTYHHTQLNGSTARRIFRAKGHLLAEIGSSPKWLMTDMQESVIQTRHISDCRQSTYCPYGYSDAVISASALAGFNGERMDSFTGCYPLGNGYRFYNPSLMRFTAPDNISPFGQGGYNSFAYCSGEPVNFVDRTGHMRTSLHGSFTPTKPPISVQKYLSHQKQNLAKTQKNAKMARRLAHSFTELANSNYDTEIVARSLGATTDPPVARRMERIVDNTQQRYRRAREHAASSAETFRNNNYHAQELSQRIAELEGTVGALLVPGDHSSLSAHREQTPTVTIKVGTLLRTRLSTAVAPVNGNAQITMQLAGTREPSIDAEHIRNRR